MDSFVKKFDILRPPTLGDGLGASLKSTGGTRAVVYEALVRRRCARSEHFCAATICGGVDLMASSGAGFAPWRSGVAIDSRPWLSPL